MKKFYKLLLSKKGFTLVEILVVLIVASILLICATGMLTPVNNLLNSVKGNAHMDATCDTINEYMRGTLEKAEKICIIPYSQIDTLKSQWKTYTDSYNASNGYEVRAMGVMENYNGDFRLYDFGNVTTINYSWGWNPSSPLTIQSANDGSDPGNAFGLLMEYRDGGGRSLHNGFDGNEFHWFDAFNEEFYSNGAMGQVNNSYQIAFELNNAGGTPYLTVSSQMFKRTGKNEFKSYSGGKYYFETLAKYEPTNQIKQMSFKLLNASNATIEGANSVNTVDTTADGIKYIKLAPDPNALLDSDHSVQKQSQDGIVILYVVRNIDAYYALP